MSNIKGALSVPLLISGNGNNGAGFGTLYSFNNPPFQIENVSPGGMSSVAYYFIVRITERNVQYQLIHNKITAFQASREGVLKMGISILKGYRLCNNASPWDVLTDVYKVMLQKNCRKKNGTEDEYEFNEYMCDGSEISEVLNRYSIEPQLSLKAYRPMTGESVPLLVLDSDEKTSEFMRDPHYHELSGYKEVIVAKGGDVELRVPNLKIPRQSDYKLFVNGIETTWPNGNPWDNEQTIFTNEELDPKCYTAQSLVFKPSYLDDPRSAPNGIVVNQELEAVRCTIQKRDVQCPYNIDTRDSNGNKISAIKGYITVVLDGQQLCVSDNRFTLSGEQNIADSSRFKVGYTGDDYEYVRSEFNANNSHKLKVTLKKVKKPEPLPQPVPSNESRNNIPSYNSQRTPSTLSFEHISILLPSRVLTSRNDTAKAMIRIDMSSALGCDNLYWRKEIEFSLNHKNELRKDTEDFWLAVVDVPKLPPYRYNINIECRNVRLKKENCCLNNIFYLEELQQGERGNPQYKAQKNVPGFDFRKEAFECKRNKWPKRAVIIWGICAIFCAFVVGFETGKHPSVGKGEEQEKDTTDAMFGQNPVSGVNESQFERINDLIARLNDDDVTFQEIKDLKGLLDQNNGKFNHVQKPTIDAHRDRILSYYQLVVDIENLDINNPPKEYDDLRKRVNNESEFLTLNQKNALLNVFDNKYDSNKAEAMKEAVMQEVKEDKINSFVNIGEIAVSTAVNQGTSTSNGTSSKDER